jgi:hypothetical protein
VNSADPTAITNVSAQLSAFGLTDDRDAVLLVDLAPGQYTVNASGVNDATGIAIVELYDADTNPTSRLTSIANRGFAGIGDEVMIPGFVISTEGPKTVLLRVVGPTLFEHGVTGTMDDPELTLFRRETDGFETPLATNDNWQDNPDAAYTAQVAQDVFAFPLADGSTDAAMVVTLNPGVYSVVGSAADGVSSGVVLVEVYIVE